ncbi:MAG: hypothetical protein A2W01_03120 [Candidatus Solincola sediminis]|nr:MAG: hypothetical protein A2W01_03120 [Candidatus Solincola sediminis]
MSDFRCPYYFLPLLPMAAYLFIILKRRGKMWETMPIEAQKEAPKYQSLAMTLAGISLAILTLTLTMNNSCRTTISSLKYFMLASFVAFLLAFLIQRDRKRWLEDILGDALLDTGLFCFLMGLLFSSQLFGRATAVYIVIGIAVLCYFFYLIRHLMNYDRGHLGGEKNGK